MRVRDLEDAKEVASVNLNNAYLRLDDFLEIGGIDVNRNSLGAIADFLTLD